MGTHQTKPFAFSLAGLIALAVASPVAALVPGGGPPSSDCVSAWQVTTADVAANRGPTGVDCQDGDPACDADGEANGSCTFGVSVCTASVAVKGCTPDGVSAFTFSRKATKLGVTGPAVPTTEPVCGPATLIPVALKKTPQGFRQSRTVVLASTATTEHGRDRDTVRLRCVPNVGAGECPPIERRPARPYGRRGERHRRNGVSGWSHNFRYRRGRCSACLTGCDPTTNRPASRTTTRPLAYSIRRSGRRCRSSRRIARRAS
jgi:hypothetical protein